MATYAELYTLSLDAGIVQRMTIAVAVAAEAINAESVQTYQHAERVAWAKRAMFNPDGMARQMLTLALAQSRAATAATIAAVDDATLQAATDAAVSLLL